MYSLPLALYLPLSLIYSMWANYLLSSGYIVSIPNESSQISHLPYPRDFLLICVFFSSSRFTNFLSPFPLPLLLAKSTSRVFIGILCCGCLPRNEFVDKFVKWVAALSMAHLCEPPSLLYTFDKGIGVSFVGSILCILNFNSSLYTDQEFAILRRILDVPRGRGERTKRCANKCQIFPFIFERCLKHLRSYWVDFIAR